MQPEDLVVEFRARDDRQWELLFRDARSRELHRRVAWRQDLRELALPQRLRLQEPEREFSGPQGAARGHALCRWLFGDADEQRALVGDGWPGARAARWAPNVRSASFHLELRTADPELLGQPWHLLSWEGAPLLSSGWTIRVAPPHLPATRGELPWPPRVLALAPGAARHAHDDIGAVEHLESARRIYAAAGGPPGSLRVTTTREELTAALRSPGRWDMFYYFGHGVVEDGVAGLLPDDGEGRPCFLGVDALATLLRDAPPAVVYLNTCSVGAGGWHGAGNTLCFAGNVVLAHLCKVRVDPARARALRFFHRLLHDGDDPVTSFLETADISQPDIGWMCGAVHSGVRAWRVARPRASLASLPAEDWALRLDRRPQRMMVNDRVSSYLLRAASPLRGAAFVAVASRYNHLHKLGAQLFSFLRDDDRLTQRLVKIDVGVPPDDASSQEPWDEHMLAALEAGPDTPLADALTAYLRGRGIALGEGDGRAVVWFDFGGWPRHTTGRPIVKTKRWLQRCRHWTERCFAALPTVRVAFFIGLEVDAPLRDKITRVLNKPGTRDELNSETFGFDLLQEPGPIAYQDVREFLRVNTSHGLPDAEQREVATIVFNAASADSGKPRYDLAVDLLQRGREDGWERLRREHGDADDDDDDDDDV